MSMNVNNDIKNWHGLLSKLEKTQTTQAKDDIAHTVAPKSLTRSPQKSSALPSRAAPKASQSAEVKDGIDSLSNSRIQFSIETLIQLLFELALKQREARRESRMADATAAEEMGMAAAEDLKDEGAMEVTGATLLAGAQVAGAATVVGGGVRTAKTDNVLEVSNKMMSYQATSQSFGAVGQLSKGGTDYEAKQDEAQKALHDASATQAKSIEDSDNEDQKDEAQLIQSIVQLKQQQEESRHEAVRATA